MSSCNLKISVEWEGEGAIFCEPGLSSKVTRESGLQRDNPHWDVVNKSEKRAPNQKCRKEGPQRKSSLVKLDREHALLGVSRFPVKENHEKHAANDEETDRLGRVPSKLGSTGCQPGKQKHRGNNQHDGSGPINLRKSLEPRLFMRLARDLHEEKDGEQRDGPNWQIDEEAPAPGKVLGKSSAHKWTDDAGNGKHGAHDAGKEATLFNRDVVGDDDCLEDGLLKIS